MARGLGILALVLVVGLGLWLAGTAGRGGARVEPRGAEPPPERPDAQLTQPPRDDPTPERRVAAELSPPSEVEAAPPAEAPPEAGCLLRGRLVDAETSVGLVGYRLRIAPRFRTPSQRASGPAEVHRVTTGEGGAFEIELAPAEYIVFHDADAGTAETAVNRSLDPWIVELQGQTVDQVFLARAPPATLEVEVVDGGAQPVEGARVHFAATFDDPPILDQVAHTDAAGRARVGVWAPEAFRDAHLRAWHGDGRVSDPLPQQAPLVPGLRRLVLAPGAVLEVRVSDTAGVAVDQRRVLLASEIPNGPYLYGSTDDAGEVRFESLFAGPYSFQVWHAELGQRTVVPVEILRGEVRRLQVTVEERERTLAVGGRVVDENGGPLEGVELVVEPTDSWTRKVHTDAQGRFACYDAGGGPLRVRINLASEGDRFAPGEQVAAHGTTDLLFERVEAAVLRSFEVEVVDAVSGEELKDFVATIDRGPGTERWSNSYAPRRDFELAILPDTRWRVVAKGYIVTEVALAEALDALEEGQRLRVALRPGLDHELVVLDADTDEPLEGVEVRSETAGGGRTDAGGRLRLHADHWSVYRVHHPGFQPEDWDPDDAVLWDYGPLHLEREEQDG